MVAAALAVIVVAGAGTAAPIIGGTPADDDAVVAVAIAGGLCTGVVVAPTVVLTAAHCAAPGVGLPAPGTVGVGDAAPFDVVADVVDLLVHRRYAGQGTGADLALLRVEPALAVAPRAWQRAPLPAIVGEPVRLVGYGLTRFGEPGSDGARQQVTLAVRGADGEYLIVGEPARNTCQGDSGGPALWDGGAGEVVVAVTSFGDVGCAGDARLGRVDLHAGLIDEVIAAWSGPCAADGACVTDGCGAWPDPDCDPCGLDGACAAGCARVDLDCPLGELEGAPCAADLDCESRWCLPAPEDPRHAFCSTPCDPAAGGADCPAPLGACDAGACVYAGPTPGVIGAPCDEPGDCRSGLCDPMVDACAEPCGPGGACPAGFACEPVGAGEACTTPAGCCAVGSGGPPDLAVVLVGGIAAAGLRRRLGRRRGPQVRA